MRAPVDAFFDDAERWGAESVRLRALLLDCGLDEALKWRKPCYGVGGKNIAIIQPMKGFLALMFFKGALLKDPNRRLESQGENTRSALRLCFTSVDQIDEAEVDLRDSVKQAIALEASGARVAKPAKLELVDELKDR